MEIKPYLVSYDTIPQGIEKQLDLYIKEGNITPSRNGLFVDSDYEILTLAAPSWLKKEVKRISGEKGITMEELLFEIVFEYLLKES
ncbi:hypothetical protein AB9M62_23270 [Bacillales bacterium AN1005]